MVTDQNKAVYRRFIQEVFNEGRLDTLDEVLSRSYVDHDAPPGTPPGPEGIKLGPNGVDIAPEALCATCDSKKA